MARGYVMIYEMKLVDAVVAGHHVKVERPSKIAQIPIEFGSVDEGRERAREVAKQRTGRAPRSLSCLANDNFSVTVPLLLSGD